MKERKGWRGTKEVKWSEERMRTNEVADVSEVNKNNTVSL